MDKAKLEKIVDVAGFLIYSGFAVDAIHNVVKGNYAISAIEGLISVCIGFEEYKRRQDRKFDNSDEQKLIALSERVDIIERNASSQEPPYND
ncbi:MAG: hypothetical protein QF362_00510 [Candidatus Woesearchaeota archaeon]|jgi:hypothetical protein|nr:hypothetical protein [Candidatus Woesearchaeota archaeon]MDP7505912.1 hypothetical protein [Candidatus Woesearchaeota archaeon]|tara:strand:- start:329 stop:604 length:276 start_codon:yes stop_codon:yes gene_type:complete